MTYSKLVQKKRPEPMEIRNVVIVNDHAFVNGGQAKIAIESAITLAKAGLSVTFFAPCGPCDRRLTDAGVRTICLEQNEILTEPNRIKAMAQGIWNPKAARSLKALLQQFDPANSVVHCHGFAKANSPSIGPVLTNGPLPHVFTMHEYFLACPNGAFYDFQSHKICTRKALSPSCLLTHCDARRRAHKAWRVARQAALWSAGGLPKNLRHVIYLSDLQKHVMQPYLHADTQLYFVPNPIDFSGGKRVRVEDNSAALFIGRLTPEKGCVLFAKAARDANMPAVFVGDGPEKDAILSANPDAIITGWVESNEVEHWLSKTRCLVFPTLLYETFGLVAYEALAKGVPVICGNWTAANEAVTHDKTGWIVNSRKPEDWAAALMKVKQNDIRPHSQAAHRLISERQADEASYHERLIAVYNTVLNG